MTTPESTERRDEAALTALQQTLPGCVAAFAQTRPDEVALREKLLGIWQETTWRGYLAEIEAVAHQLWAMGLRPGDCISILSDNRPEWLYADLGAQAIGVRSVGIYQTNPPEDVAYILTHSKSKLIFCEDQEQVDKVVEVRADTPDVKDVVVFDPRGTRHIDDDRLLHWSKFTSAGHELRAEKPGWFMEQLDARDPEDPTMVVYTSGTTGPPKGAMISSSNVLSIAKNTAEEIGFMGGDTLLSYLPLCHVAEKIFTVFLPLTTGSVVHFGESIYTVQDDLREVAPTIFLGVPRIWEKINAAVEVKMKDASWLKRTLYQWGLKIGHGYQAQRHKGALSALDRAKWFVAYHLVFRSLQEQLGLRRCRYACSGAAPISQDLLRWFHAVGIPVLEGYGQTECAGVSHISRPDHFKLGTVGQPIPGVECRLGDDGEVLLHGALVFKGYLHNADATANTIDEDGWLHTGDIGSIDEDGFLSITGRKKEIIITSGGKNLSPEKIENALKTSPYIKEAIAIGDRRKFISALVQIEYDTVGDWATRRELPYTSFPDLASKPDVIELIDKEIRRANDLLAQVEQVRSFRLLPKELNQDDGELTATQKVRRRAVYDAYEPLIEAMYTKKKS